jgi:hypothetical protein
MTKCVVQYVIDRSDVWRNHRNVTGEAHGYGILLQMTAGDAACGRRAAASSSGTDAFD